MPERMRMRMHGKDLELGGEKQPTRKKKGTYLFFVPPCIIVIRHIGGGSGAPCDLFLGFDIVFLFVVGGVAVVVAVVVVVVLRGKRSLSVIGGRGERGRRTYIPFTSPRRA